MPAPALGQEPSVDSEVIAGDYFGTFKAPLLRGRPFDRARHEKRAAGDDYRSGPGREIFSGRRSDRQTALDRSGRLGKDNRWYEIVGVAPKMKFHGANEIDTVPVIYFRCARRNEELWCCSRGRRCRWQVSKGIARAVSEIDLRAGPSTDAQHVRARSGNLGKRSGCLHFYCLFSPDWRFCSRPSDYTEFFPTMQCVACAKSPCASRSELALARFARSCSVTVSGITHHRLRHRFGWCRFGGHCPAERPV